MSFLFQRFSPNYRALLPGCVFLLAYLILGGCAAESDVRPPSVARVTDTPAPTLSPTLTNTTTPTPSPSPTVTPTFTPSPAPTSTPQPTLSWASDIEPLVSFEDKFNAYWSPTANEIVLDNCFLYMMGADKNVLIAQAPDFKTIDVTPDELDCGVASQFEIFWTPDGQQLLYFGPTPDDNENYYYGTRELWLMNRDGSNAHPINFGETASRLLEVVGWIDNQTLVYVEQSGTGMSSLILDTLTGEHFGTLDLQGPRSVAKPNATYMIANDCRGDKRCFIYALPKSDTPYANRWDSHANRWDRLTEDSHPLVVLESTFEIRHEGLTWLPGTNKLLIRTVKSSVPALELSLWDTEEDTLTLIASNGYQGHFSPDGQFLAYLELGVIKFDVYGLPQISNEANVPIILHILDMFSQEEMLSVPIILDLADWRTGYTSWSETPLLQFSSDGRYVAFFTAEQIQLDEPGQPTYNVISHEQPAYLNLFNTHTGEIVFSTLSLVRDPVWSPQDNRLIYQDVAHNWVLLDVSNDNLTSLTQTGGVWVVQPKWSFDGQYLSFRVNNEIIQPNAEGKTEIKGEPQVVIFQVP